MPAPTAIKLTKAQRATIDDVVTWAEMAEKSGLPKGSLSQWYLRNRNGLADAAVRPDMRPPLFLWSTVGPILDSIKAEA